MFEEERECMLENLPLPSGGRVGPAISKVVCDAMTARVGLDLLED